MEAAEKCLMTQHVFRALHQAMSNPGTVHDVPQEQEHTDGGHDILLALAETILDNEASFCLVGKDGEQLERIVRDLTGSRKGDAAPAFDAPGSTIIYLVAGFNGGPDSCSFSLRGSGIGPVMSFSVEGIGRDELCGIKDVNKDFPLGVNCIFVDLMGKIACIPRSATVIDLRP